MVIDERASYFANPLISSSKRHPRVLFDIINNTIPPEHSIAPVFSYKDCNKFKD